jgi:aminopeptidase N
VLGYARWTVADRYLPAGLRDAALADITSLCRDLLSLQLASGASEAGGAGGEMRLVAVRGLIDSASGPGDISALWSWLAAGRVPGGPELDSRLRWQILLRLTVLGAASRAEIEHDADRDATAAGWLSAARCRAALPDDDAKQAARGTSPRWPRRPPPGQPARQCRRAPPAWCGPCAGTVSRTTRRTPPPCGPASGAWRPVP